MRVQIDIKGKINRNELYGEKNRGPAYILRFVTIDPVNVFLISWVLMTQPKI